jgi:hypothetical protein
MIRGTVKQRSAFCLRFPASVSAFAAGNLQKFTLAAPRRSSSIGRGQPPIGEKLVFAAQAAVRPLCRSGQRRATARKRDLIARRGEIYSSHFH